MARKIHLLGTNNRTTGGDKIIGEYLLTDDILDVDCNRCIDRFSRDRYNFLKAKKVLKNVYDYLDVENEGVGKEAWALVVQIRAIFKIK